MTSRSDLVQIFPTDPVINFLSSAAFSNTLQSSPADGLQFVWENHIDSPHIQTAASGGRDILTLVLKDYIIQDCFILSGSDISDSTWTKWRWMDVDTRTFSLFSYIIHRTVFRSLLRTTQTQLPSFKDMFRAQEVFYFETLSRLE